VGCLHCDSPWRERKIILAAVAADGMRTNVVEAPASLIGRTAERAAIAACFDEGTRLVTLVGPGGVGKTRLAARFALDHATAYSAHGGGGAWLCDLTDMRSAMAICAAVATTLDLPLDRDTSEVRVAAELGRRIARRRRTLIILDNCEQVAREVGAVVSEWLVAAPRAHFLITSRVALGVPGEQLWPLAGLAVPDPDATPEDARASDAVELFVRRARQVRPELALVPSDLAAIAELVRRLDGLPLAIELAAARVRVLSPAQLLARLAVGLLSRPGDAGRHGSIRGAVLDSVDSLDPIARTTFARCAVFRGGFTMHAAETVLADRDAEVLGALEALCDHSLVRTLTVGEPPTTRFQMYETIREVAVEQLALRADRDQLAEGHARYYATLGRDLGERATAHADREALAELGAELENLVEAHRHALASSAPDAPALALASALALAPLVARRGMFRLWLRLLDAAIESRADVSEELAAAHLARGRAHRELGNFELARADWSRGHELAERVGSTVLAAQAELGLGELVEITGATADARVRYTRALERLAAGPAGPLTRIREAEAHAALGHALRREGALDEAVVEIARALERYRAAHHQDGIAAMTYEAAVVALFRDQHDVARARLDEALVLARALGARQFEAAVTSGLGIVRQAAGELDAAVALHAAAVQVFRDLGNVHREGSALYYLAAAYLERGELAEAHAVLDQAVAAIRAVGVPRYEALIEAARGAAYAIGDERQAAIAAFDRAKRAAAACHSEPALHATIAIHELHLDDRDPAARLADARTLALAAPGDDPRLALRVLATPLRVPLADALLVRPGAAAFRPPGAATDVDLSRRQPLRRLLAVLAHHRVAEPGDSLGLDDLLAAGWPGERITQEAAVNRVHVALTTLRKLGLRQVLKSSDRGYLLDPAIGILVE